LFGSAGELVDVSRLRPPATHAGSLHRSIALQNRELQPHGSAGQSELIHELVERRRPAAKQLDNAAASIGTI
jgi:hypothetical protein